jgi:lipopolysaccharide transport system ATP-binding protein
MNGAGKSTLLKILSRTTAPTTGSIKMKGRVASLLEVGTGFHPELTGKENIYLNGSILGMRGEEIKSKFDEIVDFAGVERYIDTPVKRYSSGMYVRLAFAVAAHLEPEILIVDEVLAVGDLEFQKKAIGKMKEVSNSEGRTVLFVSHNLAAVRNLCSSAILLKNGQQIINDRVEVVADYYINNLFEFNDQITTSIEARHRTYTTSDEVTITSVRLINNQNSNLLASVEPLTLAITVSAKKSVPQFRIAVGIFSLDEACIGVVFSKEELSIKSNESKTFRLVLKDHQLAKGQYYVNLSLGIGNEVSGIKDYDIVSKAIFFEVAFSDMAHEQMIKQWNQEWGKINFQKIEVNEINT